MTARHKSGRGKRTARTVQLWVRRSKARYILTQDGDAVEIHVQDAGERALVSGLISACDDVVTETDHRLHGGAGAPGLGR
jgi:hypothetical protein